MNGRAGNAAWKMRTSAGNALSTPVTGRHRLDGSLRRSAEIGADVEPDPNSSTNFSIG
ncbi:hypothetical protein HQN59_05080 [Schlegelella sp. ID0723]|uniref:Uncharacterized protein n=1 Tax=Piscinibacter koreensis TaxID=2742824 RepID=A0A7Y6TVP1_9BURK|nr:hypothetical protein [Schlegelella koreensis]